MTKLPKLTEAQFLRQVIQLAKLDGWRVAHFRPAMKRDGTWRTAVQGDGVGWPDLVLLRGNDMIAAELKLTGKEATPEQEKWLAAFAHVGARAEVWWPNMWPHIEKVLRRSE